MNLDDIDFEAEWDNLKSKVKNRWFDVYTDGDIASHFTSDTKTGYKQEFFCNIDAEIVAELITIWKSLDLILSYGEGYRINPKHYES